MSPHSDDDDFPSKEEDEVSIPRASLNKFVKEVLPDARLTTDTRDLLLNCCHFFIHKLATEANIACSKANKKTISPQHILEGLDAMNLSSYKEHAEVACQEAKVEIKGRKMLSASYRFKHQDSEELERLAKEQQEIFEQARADFIGERLDRGDLLAASNYAASDLSNFTTGHRSQSSNYPNINSTDVDTSDTSALPTATGSGRILGASVIEDDDNYDE
ncbi:hypothetical protein MN116_002404 [Schistosoma mekongi]|uniref:Protein Dr1 n=1 Tax=Schistosoma mekongi TaxID=38744 RepID=A0AAE1ZKY3_SCHME|nr:hypothetical protein MN116_002404 [Schistosoma mekongi]